MTALTGRPKSQNPKGHVASVRITDEERTVLVKRFGSVGKGLRAALNDWKARTTDGERSEPRAPRGAEVKGAYVDEVQMMTDEDVDKVVAEHREGTHVHRPAAKVGDVYYVKGTAYQKWTCECGHEMDRKAS